MKTAEMKIQFYTEGKKTLCRVLIYDTHLRIWRELTGAGCEINALICHAYDVIEKFENGGFNNAKK